MPSILSVGSPRADRPQCSPFQVQGLQGQTAPNALHFKCRVSTSRPPPMPSISSVGSPRADRPQCSPFQVQGLHEQTAPNALHFKCRVSTSRPPQCPLFQLQGLHEQTAPNALHFIAIFIIHFHGIDIFVCVTLQSWIIFPSCRSVDIYSTVALASEPVAPTINVRELIHQSSKEAGWDSTVVGGGVLSPAQASKVLCGLSQEVDRYVTSSLLWGLWDWLTNF